MQLNEKEMYSKCVRITISNLNPCGSPKYRKAVLLHVYIITTTVMVSSDASPDISLDTSSEEDEAGPKHVRVGGQQLYQVPAI